MSSSEPLGNKGLTQREIARIEAAIKRANPTEDELAWFIQTIEERISGAFAAHRARSNSIPIVQQEAYRQPQS